MLGGRISVFASGESGIIGRTYLAALAIVVLGALGTLSGWFSWKLPLIMLLALTAIYFLLRWLGRPRRYRGKTFSEFPHFLGSWSEAFDRGSRIFIRAEAPRAHQLRFRLSGRGTRKMLRVSLPKLRATAVTLRRELKNLLAPVEGAFFRERPRSIEVALPAYASFTASVASRVARRAFGALGYHKDARFTIWAEGVEFDPYYDLKISERAVAKAPPGMLKRFCQRRVNRLRAVLPEAETPSEDLPPNQQMNRR